MNRTIKFRGKRIIADNWVFGDLESRPKTGATFIHQYYPNGVYHTQHRVEPESVGQFTGLQDAHGTDIYEGDLLLSYENGEVFEVVYDAPRFCFKDNVFGFKFLNHPENFKVLGNIFDNKDFMERNYHRPVIQNVAELLKDTSYYANKYPDSHTTYADLETLLMGSCDLVGSSFGIPVADGEERCYGFLVESIDGGVAIVKYIGLMKS